MPSKECSPKKFGPVEVGLLGELGLGEVGPLGELGRGEVGPLGERGRVEVGLLGEPGPVEVGLLGEPGPGEDGPLGERGQIEAGRPLGERGRVEVGLLGVNLAEEKSAPSVNVASKKSAPLVNVAPLKLASSENLALLKWALSWKTMYPKLSPRFLRCESRARAKASLSLSGFSECKMQKPSFRSASADKPQISWCSHSLIKLITFQFLLSPKLSTKAQNRNKGKHES